MYKNPHFDLGNDCEIDDSIPQDINLAPNVCAIDNNRICSWLTGKSGPDTIRISCKAAGVDVSIPNTPAGQAEKDSIINGLLDKGYYK